MLMSPPMKPGASTATNGLTKAEIVLALALTAFSAGLHFHWKLNAGGLWRDEVGSVQFATMTSWGEIWKDLAFDNFPPLLLPFLRAWHGLGLAPDDSGWRNFGLGVGLLFLLLAWATSRFLLLRPPLLLLSVVGLSPLAVRTLDTLRPYGLGIVLMIAAFAAFYKTALNPSLRRTILAALCATLAVQTLYQNSVLILALFCGAVALAWRVKCARAAWHLLAASMVAAVSVLPHLGHLRASQDFGVIAQGPVDFRHLLAVTASALAESGPIPLWLFPATVLAALAWIIFPGRWPFSAATRPIAWFIIPVVLVGTTGFYLFLLASKLPTQPWYYVILLALAACAVDSMATLDAPVAFRWSRLGAAAVLALGAVPFSWPGSALRMTTVDLLAAKVTRGAVPEGCAAEWM